MAEQRSGVPVVLAKIRQHRPRVTCFVGKGIYEIFAGEKCKTLGLQTKTIAWENHEGFSRIFVMPSTSGIVSAYQKPDKLKFFRELASIAIEEDKKYDLQKSIVEESIQNSYLDSAELQ
ncbi:hypothetical protein EC973_000367 [Apophysomyces ossiformis]|uniref:Uracil-DNA glycosylase-like domain-containing protein n=1 Tax=Apophysomyces ossiformis TaxID=679940 RepID=A0A8H7BNK2_9FUNG|nr:hypothetical protein EC973_000367 [Apophysomyces ossiformis]